MKKRKIPADYFIESPKRKSDVTFFEGLMLIVVFSLIIYSILKYF